MSILSAIKLILTLRCEESSRLMSASLDRELTRPERLAIRFHARMCRHCHRYRRQIQFLRDALRSRHSNLLSVEAPASPDALSPDARRRIRSALTHDRDS